MSQKPVAVTGSPNTITEIAVDVQEGYLTSPLLGSLTTLELEIQNKETKQKLLVLGQLSELSTSNRWHEDAALKNYLKRKGRLPNLTEVGDVTTAEVQVLGAYLQKDAALEKTRLSIPAGSGIPVHLAERATIERIMSGERGYAYIGRFYGNEDVPAPVYVRHFGDFNSGGNGEAYMGGVFGPSGSGKSVLAATLDAFWASNPDMGMLILDPQSEFATNGFAKGTPFKFNFHEMLKVTTKGKFDPARDVISIDTIKFDGMSLFVALLTHRGFFSHLGLGAAKVEQAAENVEMALDEFVKRQQAWTLGTLLADLDANHVQVASDLRQAVVTACAQAYAAPTQRARTDRAATLTNTWTNTHKTAIDDAWDSVAKYFAPNLPNGKAKYELQALIQGVMFDGKKLILDLDPAHLNLRDDFKLNLMHFVFKRISGAAHAGYKGTKMANCLIVLDEAGRFIPQSSDDEGRRDIAQYITAKVKELRKQRVGFQFITQTLAEIQKDIFRSLHYRVYGVGMSVGTDADNIRSREGDEAYDMYEKLPDPRLSGTYSFMVCGAILALGTTGKPMYIQGFNSDTEILANNGLTMSGGTGGAGGAGGTQSPLPTGPSWLK